MTAVVIALVCVVAVLAVAVQVAEPVIDGILRDRAHNRRSRWVVRPARPARAARRRAVNIS
ncbi:MAG: hypothetical protein ACTHNU_16315 [Gaiellales bacterium]